MTSWDQTRTQDSCIMCQSSCHPSKTHQLSTLRRNHLRSDREGNRHEQGGAMPTSCRCDATHTLNWSRQTAYLGVALAVAGHPLRPRPGNIKVCLLDGKAPECLGNVALPHHGRDQAETEVTRSLTRTSLLSCRTRSLGRVTSLITLSDV